MSNDILEGRWKQIPGSTIEKWRKLTDSDLDRIWGKRDQFVGALQEKYDYARAKTGEEIERRLRDQDQKHVALALRTQRMNKRQSIGW